MDDDIATTRTTANDAAICGRRRLPLIVAIVVVLHDDVLCLFTVPREDVIVVPSHDIHEPWGVSHQK